MKNSQLTPSLEAVIEEMPGHVWWKDKSLRYLGCNAQVLHLLGLSQREFIGKTDHELWGKEIADKLLQADRQVLSTGKNISLEEVIQKKDGVQLIMLTNKSPYFDRTHHIAGIIGTSTDITCRKKAEEELKIAKDAQEAANKAKTEFLQNMRHDIRTPLVGITGCAHAIKDNISDPHKIELIKEYADALITSSYALTTLLNEIVEAIKITEGAMPLVKKKFNLKEKLLTIIELNQAKAQQKNLVLTLEHDARIPHYLIGDHPRIHRLILELVTNALKFTNRGWIKVATELSFCNEKNMIIKMSVTDTGIGISQNKQEEVFTRFNRLTPSWRGIYPGMGLGLALVKQLIDDLEAEIYLESKPEEGSKFTCVIPLKETLLDEQLGVDTICMEPKKEVYFPKWQATVLPQVKPTSSELISILLVEDQLIPAKVAQSLLAGFNCTVDIAQDGQMALEYAKSKHYDFILMDIGLPDQSGKEVTRQIRDWERLQNKHTPIIALTAHVGDENKEECLQAGMEAVLSKPLSKEVALHLLNIFVPKFKMAS